MERKDDLIVIDVTPRDGGDWRPIQPRLIPKWLAVLGGIAVVGAAWWVVVILYLWRVGLA